MDATLIADFIQQDSVIADTDIDILQSHFNQALPTSYREFLQQYGNVTLNYPLPNSVLITINNKTLIGGIHYFLSPTEVYERYQALREESYYAEEPQIDEHMLPIAEMVDLNEGEYILLDLNNGEVLSNLFDYSEATNRETYGIVAPSFEALLEQIKPQTELEHIAGENALYELINVDS